MVQPGLNPRSTWLWSPSSYQWGKTCLLWGWSNWTVEMVRKVWECLFFQSWSFYVRASFRVRVWERKEDWLLLCTCIWHLHPKYLLCSENHRKTICSWRNLTEMAHLKIRRWNRKEGAQRMKTEVIEKTSQVQAKGKSHVDPSQRTKFQSESVQCPLR